jgi:feruloyl esterase
MRSLAIAALGLLLAAPAAVAQGPAPGDTTRAPAGACPALRTLRLPDVRITDVDDARAPRPDDNVRVPHCRVSGVVGRAIRFVVVLPDAWNQRLFMGGNGGFAGSLNRAALAPASQGYVAVTTDTGHDDPDGGARWALHDLEAQLDYAYVGVHRTVEVAKVLAKAYYGMEPKYAYFNGCSNGGRQALMEVQRYPDDFDGVIAGAPAAQFTRIGVSFLKNLQAVFPTPRTFGTPLVTQANLDLLSAKVLDACDALDGVTDGVIDDPRACHFRLASIRACPADRAAPDCLTRAQRAAIAAVYAPATDARGAVVYPGQPFGGERFEGGWPAWITGSDTALMRRLGAPSLQAMFAVEGAKYFTYGDSAWDYTRTSPAAVAADARRRTAPFLDAVDPDLSRFAARKGKLLLYHGWADPALNPLGTIEYYDQVLARDPGARDYARLFMMPGVLHCGGGAGPDQAPWLRTVVDWVERGRAPERVVAAKRDSAGKVLRSRPLCPYPQRAAHAGDGSTDDERSYACRDPGAGR